MAELKPCPFCGGSVSIAESGDDYIMWWFITRGTGNKACGCRLFMESECVRCDDFELKAEMRKNLIEAWNRRTEDGRNEV